MRHLDFIYFDAGAGHRSAASALKLVIERQQRPWAIRMVNLQEVLDEVDLARALTGLRLQDIYNRMLERGWTLGARYLVPAMHALMRATHGRQVAVLERFWKREPPDLVVSFVPHFNRALLQAVKRVRPDTELLTIMTDLADYPPHFWLERQEQYLVCGSEKAVAQALNLGHHPDRVMRASGMILHPHFYERQEADPREERRRLGLHPVKLTGLVLFGGWGSPAMVTILERLDRSDLPVQLIFICGHNERLAHALRAMPARISVAVEGFTSEIPYYMHISDFFVGKPGPGSISEALRMGLPLIVERNAWTLPQERYNATWIRENGVGIVISHMRHIERAVRELLDTDRLDRYRRSAAALDNRAVFEIPDMIEKILHGAAPNLRTSHTP